MTDKTGAVPPTGSPVAAAATPTPSPTPGDLYALEKDKLLAEKNRDTMNFAQGLGGAISGGFGAAAKSLAEGGNAKLGQSEIGSKFAMPQMPVYGGGEEDLSANFKKKKPLGAVAVG